MIAIQILVKTEEFVRMKGKISISASAPKDIKEKIVKCVYWDLQGKTVNWILMIAGQIHVKMEEFVPIMV